MPRTALAACLQGRCPRCRTGKMFQYSSVLPGKFDKMYETCPACGLRFEVEPGFWYGAMYVSYAITTGLVLVAGFTLNFGFNDPPLSVYLWTIFALIIVAVPFTFRFSRVAYLHLFGGVDYDPTAIAKHGEQQDRKL